MSRSEAATAGSISVLEVEPDLAAELDASQLAAALPRLRAATIHVEPGDWAPPAQSAGAFRLLVVDGVVGRDVVLTGVACSELLAPGDLLRAPQSQDGYAFIPVGMAWCVVETATIAVLDERFAAAALRWPPVVTALMARAVHQTESSAIHLAITCLMGVRLRLHVLFWHLADRFGRVEPAGVAVPLNLTHALLARLVRARRPSVTLALGELREQDLVIRRDDGSWLLRGRPPQELSGQAEGLDVRPVE